MQDIPLIQEYVKIFMQLFCMVFIILKWKDVKEIFCGEDGRMSSKRVIAIMGMSTLCRLSIFVTTVEKGVNNNILAVLTTIVLTASAIATFPQILQAIAFIKNTVAGIKNKAEPAPEPEPQKTEAPTVTTTTTTEVKNP